MTEGHCPCRCDRRSDTLTGQLRPFPQDYSARPLLHLFTAQPRASSCQRGAPAGHTSDLQINFRINDKLLPHPLCRARAHTRGHPLSGSSCCSRDKAVASLQAAVLIIHRRSRGGRAVRNGGGAQALNFTPSSNNAKWWCSSLWHLLTSVTHWLVALFVRAHRGSRDADTDVCKLSGNIRVKTCECDLVPPPHPHTHTYADTHSCSVLEASSGGTAAQMIYSKWEQRSSHDV